MITATLTFICFLIASAIAAGAFYFGKHINGIQQDNARLTSDYDRAVNHIHELETHIEELVQENDFLKVEQQDRRDRNTGTRWNPADPLNSASRQ